MTDSHAQVADDPCDWSTEASVCYPFRRLLDRPEVRLVPAFTGVFDEFAVAQLAATESWDMVAILDNLPLPADPGRRRVLEVGAGTGRVAIPLARRGWKVTGLDSSEDALGRLLDAAAAEDSATRERVRTVRVRLGEEDIAGAHDTALLADVTANLFPTDEAMGGLIGSLSRALVEDGRIVFAIFDDPALDLFPTLHRQVNPVPFLDDAGVQRICWMATAYSPRTRRLKKALLIERDGEVWITATTERIWTPDHLDPVLRRKGFAIHSKTPASVLTGSSQYWPTAIAVARRL